MSYFKNIFTEFTTDPSLRDAFGRLRVSSPTTLFDSKQIFNDTNYADTLENFPLFFDNAETSGSGTATAFDSNRASTTISVSNAIAGTRVRQTKRRFNYQPGKSQVIFLTGIFGAIGTDIVKRYGYYDENNGLFFEYNSTGFAVVKRSYVSGSPVDTKIYQTDWNLDKLDGTGDSGFALDFTKAQIFFIDFEWLGVGSVRFGFVIDGKLIYCHSILNANAIDSVYMSTPNCPIRAEISNAGSGSASSLEVICCSVISEAGQEETGIIRARSTQATPLGAVSAGQRYAMLGIRLKTTHLAVTTKLESFSVLSTTNDDFEWTIILNPTVASTFTYTNLANSAIEYAVGVTANTVSGGDVLWAGYGKQSAVINQLIPNIVTLGSKIDGTRDTLVLCVSSLSPNADLYGAINWREFV